MHKLLTFFNDNHWFIIGGLLIILAIFWAYGCQSQVESIMSPTKLVNRAELKNELDYMIGLAGARAESLDRQDEIKQSLLDAANVIGTGGTINPSGLLNIAATIGAISFGLNRNQKLKQATK